MEIGVDDLCLEGDSLQYFSGAPPSFEDIFIRHCDCIGVIIVDVDSFPLHTDTYPVSINFPPLIKD